MGTYRKSYEDRKKPKQRKMAGQVFDNRQLRGEHCWLVSPTVLAIEQGTPHKMTMIRRTVIVRKGRGKGKPPKFLSYL